MLWSSTVHLLQRPLVLTSVASCSFNIAAPIVSVNTPSADSFARLESELFASTYVTSDSRRNAVTDTSWRSSTRYAASVANFSRKSDHSPQRYKPNCGENVLSRNVEESFLKNPGFGSGGGWLPKFNQFFLVHRHICGKIFMKTGSVVDNRQTDRQTSGTT